MKTKIAIIAFDEIATVVANYKLAINNSVEVTSVTCIHNLTAKEDAELCANNILTNHKDGESYLIISARDGISKMYADVAMEKISDYATLHAIHCDHLKINTEHALEEDYGLPVLQNAFNDLWKKARPKNSKHIRREFRGNLKFPLGFFTPGTKCVVEVDGGSHKGPFQTTVAELVCNAPNSYVLVTDVKNEYTEMNDSYHISHVTGIVSHQAGRLKFKPDYYSKDRNQDLARDADTSAMGLKPKHHTQYRTYSPRSLLITLMRDGIKHDQSLDFEKMVTMLVNENIFHVDVVGESRWGIKVYTVGKKKLQKAIRRLLNKCLTPLFQNEVQWRKDDDDYHRQEMLRDEERYNSEHGDENDDEESTIVIYD